MPNFVNLMHAKPTFSLYLPVCNLTYGVYDMDYMQPLKWHFMGSVALGIDDQLSFILYSWVNL